LWSTSFSRWVQPLKARVHPLWEYSDHSDSTCESKEVLALSEVATRVANVLQLSVDDVVLVSTIIRRREASRIVRRM
ncbi:hypothetical protein BAE44_0000627, partial [Dichanthelium oligosanthes]